MLGDALQVAVPLRGRGLSHLARHRRGARRHDDRRLGMALGNCGVHRAVEDAVARLNETGIAGRRNRQAGPIQAWVSAWRGSRARTAGPRPSPYAAKQDHRSALSPSALVASSQRLTLSLKQRQPG